MKFYRFLSAFLLSSLLFSCSENSSVTESDVRITFVDNPCCILNEKTYTVRKGDSLKLTLVPESGFSFRSCSYEDYDYVINMDSSVNLILNDVRVPQRVRLSFASASYSVCYCLNGGEFNFSGQTGEKYFNFYSLEHHKRANTEIGVDKIHRDGYVQTGWNTSSDGNGTHIGLGSRVTLSDTPTVLYAQWEKETDTSLFETEVTASGLKITGYKGEKETDSLVIPRQIDGRKVTSIGNQAFVGVKTERFVLNENVEMLFSRAIYDCEIENLVMADSVTTSYSDSVTDGTYGHLFLNAALAPRHQGDNDNTRFADDIDSLILTEGKKRLLFYGGCSMSYGLDCRLMEQAYSSYQALNLGVIGGTTACFAFDIISNYVSEKDIFIHAPEVGSGYQLMARKDAESRMFVEVEGNYDLLSKADMREMSGVFEAFHIYQNARVQLEAGSYEDYLSSYDEYGDICIDRSMEGEDKKYTEDGEYTYLLEYTDSSAVSALAEKYDLLRNQGAKVYFSFSPVNRSGLSQESLDSEIWKAFEKAEEDGLLSYSYQSISDAEDYLYYGRYFYDTDYHLNDTGVKMRTRQLIEDLSQVL